MGKEDPSQQDDNAMDFSSLMQDMGVSPLSHDKKAHPTQKPKAKRAKQTEPLHSQANKVDPFSDECDVPQLLAGDSLSYCDHGLQKSAFRKFRNGRYSIIDDLDLHGLNSQQARELLLDFLEHTHVKQGQCVRVIHGKGHRSMGNNAILKSKVNHWLKHHQRVLAFHSCIQHDGGTGAVYVLLRQ